VLLRGIINPTTRNVTITVVMAIPGIRNGQKRAYAHPFNVPDGVEISRSSATSRLAQRGHWIIMPPTGCPDEIPVTIKA
jgi:hypothetical protein